VEIMNIRLRPVLIAFLLFAGCARFEPRVSVETQEAPAARRHQTAAAAKPVAAAADYTVARGDTLYGIAFRNKLDFRDLAAWNNIGAPYTIYPGQGLRLKPPSRTRRVTDPPAVAPPAEPAANVQQVEVAPVPTQAVQTPAIAASDSGDTQTFAIVDDAAPAADVMPDTTPQPLAPIPATTAPPIASNASVPTNSPAAAIGLSARPPKPPTPTPPPAATTPVASDVVAVDTTPRAVVDANAPTRTRDGLHWRWPAGGRVVGRFVEGDPTQQGIDIAGSLGQMVLAAADGDVVYSGNGLLGYGELVIVQHSPGFLSAYGHNQKRLVVEGAKVKAGQPIAEMGRRGGIDMLHFEIRRNGKPVDPLGYLPNR
jgi:lipoprotein NlpD